MSSERAFAQTQAGPRPLACSSRPLEKAEGELAAGATTGFIGWRGRKTTLIAQQQEEEEKTQHIQQRLALAA